MNYKIIPNTRNNFYINFIDKFKTFYTLHAHYSKSQPATNYKKKLEACIDDEHQFKTAKRPQAPGDATVRKRFFQDNLVIFRRRSKRTAFLESVNFSTCVYMQVFNFRDGYVTTFWHPSGAYICQMPGHRLSELAKGTPSQSQLSIGTIGLE